MRKKVLITGFDPFDKETVNPSWEAAKQLNGLETDEAIITAEQIPTVFRTALDTLRQAILKHQPDIVICVGQAGGRMQITPERVAINLADARIPDNEGHQPIDEEISPRGPAAYWTGLPVKRMTAKMKENGIPAAVSYTAGTFVCNYLFYGLMDHISRTSPHIRGGFIHIPFIPEQTIDKTAPSLSLDTIVRALRIAAVTAAQYDEDLKSPGGTLH
ncbi:pyroglutamyl-peptidase I [Bacillus spizizenii ATCC 6633 = JCM 2499]|uniref:Pyrrolidone-carboxylate peptidase n=1 Tax=Bacillus spizizenii (strain ATCC 23059 / NRRL B-14472 / W23) TaxID=655816 RepID=E0U0X6_BACSH|nr:pyroglutamyl-peptidase I [Bacillus spizizenii]MDU7576770.1 pyroglutamyl-peptidase I [Bacillus subtilis]ADM36329.1 pyrrolidone-carboxylate peptidase [Bacillus spizizenii str. W23]AJW85788.1 pyrrolidone-carboxylate peptidase [Bacillus spizizenii]EFG91606.1 pyrrolidone-carboxylate peptidase [Bacillus spizizenii ATCC 6633 = JCM 2499]KFK78074.1 pyroglutamyl-peptidase I [Bacillus spizizenii]